MADDFDEIIKEFSSNIMHITVSEVDKFLENYNTPEHVEQIITYYENHKILDNNRTDGLSERKRLQSLLVGILRNELARDDGSSILEWVATYGDAWEILGQVDLLANDEYEKFGDEESNVLHLLFEREDIDFEAGHFTLQYIIRTNLGLFFKPNENDISAYQRLKDNKAINEEVLRSYYSVHNFFEEKDELVSIPLSGEWEKRWDTFLTLATDDMIQLVLNENVALHLEENKRIFSLFEFVNKSPLLDFVHERFVENRQKNKKKPLVVPPQNANCKKLVEQSLIYMVNLIADEDQDDEIKSKRFQEVEDALMKGYFKDEHAMPHLKERLDTILKDNPDINQANLKKVVGIIENKFSKKYEETAKSTRRNAIIFSLLSVVLIGIPFAIYYWVQYKKACKESPVHVFHMPVSTYRSLMNQLEVDNINPEIEVMSEKGNIKRTVVLLDEPNIPYFEADELNEDTQLKILCTAGEQTKNLQQKIDDLPFLERMTVSNVL